MRNMQRFLKVFTLCIQCKHRHSVYVNRKRNVVLIFTRARSSLCGKQTNKMIPISSFSGLYEVSQNLSLFSSFYVDVVMSLSEKQWKDKSSLFC